MKNAYSISEKAVEDLENIWLYTKETWSVIQADRYYNLIIDEIEFLAGNPEGGKPMEHIKKGYRVSKVKSHVIFYRKLDERSIEIIRVLHQKMDIENRLNE